MNRIFMIVIIMLNLLNLIRVTEDMLCNIVIYEEEDSYYS